MVFSLTNYSHIHPLHFHLPFTFYLPILPTSRFVFVFFVICFVLNSSGSICSAQLLSRMGNALECTNLSRVTSLKKANLPLPSSRSCQQFLSQWWQLLHTSCHPCSDFVGLLSLYWSCACCNNCMSSYVQSSLLCPCALDISDSYSLSAPFSWRSLSLGEKGMIYKPFSFAHFMVSYFLHVD